MDVNACSLSHDPGIFYQFSVKIASREYILPENLG